MRGPRTAGQTCQRGAAWKILVGQVRRALCGSREGGGCGRNGRCRLGLVAGQLAVPDAFVLSSVDLGLEMVGPQRERASVLRLHAFAFSFSLAAREGGGSKDACALPVRAGSPGCLALHPIIHALAICLLFM